MLYEVSANETIVTCQSNEKVAERGGFEPPIRFYPYIGLANRRLQPLGHLSTGCLRKPLDTHQVYGTHSGGVKLSGTFAMPQPEDPARKTQEAL
jgi:hypothetical protein